jgi:hypothetical protein
MRSKFVRAALFGALVAAVTLVSSVAFAGSGIGGVFNLGESNSVNATTTLTGSTAGKQFQVTNTSTGAGAAGIGITVPSGKPPLVVNSATQVNNLNSNFLQGKNAAAFMQGLFGSVHGARITIPFGSSTNLGNVGRFGSLLAECRNSSAVHADMIYGATKDQLIGITGSGLTQFATLGAGAQLLGIGGDSFEAIMTAQFSGGSEVAVATIVWGDNFTAGNCDFAIQVTDTNG